MSYLPFELNVFSLIGLFFLVSFIALMILFAWVHRTGRVLSRDSRQMREHQNQNDFEQGEERNKRPGGLPPKIKSLIG